MDELGQKTKVSKVNNMQTPTTRRCNLKLFVGSISRRGSSLLDQVRLLLGISHNQERLSLMHAEYSYFFKLWLKSLVVSRRPSSFRHVPSLCIHTQVLRIPLLGFLVDVVYRSLDTCYPIGHSKGNWPKLIQLPTCLKSVELLLFITYGYLVISTLQFGCTKVGILRYFADHNIDSR